MSTSPVFLGIDFGTSNSCMAWYNPETRQAEIIRNFEGQEKTPSVVYFGAGEPLVGKPAEEMWQDEDERDRVIMSVKRDLIEVSTIALPGRRVRTVEVAAAILRKLKQDAEKYHFYKPVTHTIITCPASFSVVEQDKLRDAAAHAGFSTIEVLEEPIAAAYAYAEAALRVGQHVLVYDLGGGTFDVAVVSRESDGSYRLAMKPQGKENCGGDDFDRELYDHVDSVVQQSLGRPISLLGKTDPYFLRECRRQKENLSSYERAAFSSYLRSENGAIPFKHAVERSTFESLINSYIDTTVQLTRAILEEAQKCHHPVDTVVLIGGSSRVPLVLRSLQEVLPMEPQQWHHQDMAVALGAAYYGNTLWGTPGGSAVDHEAYRKAIEMAWADKKLDRAEVAQLDAYAIDRGLTSEEATKIERAVMGDAKEKISAKEAITRPLHPSLVGQQPPNHKPPQTVDKPPPPPPTKRPPPPAHGRPPHPSLQQPSQPAAARPAHPSSRPQVPPPPKTEAEN